MLKGLKVSCVIIAMVIINISNILFELELLNIFVFIIVFFLLSYIYLMKTTIRVILSILLCLILVISEILVLYSMTIIFGVSAEQIANNHEFRFYGIVISKLQHLYRKYYPFFLKCH